MVTKEENPATSGALVTREKINPKLSPESTTPPSHIGREVNTTIVLEKPSEDGYNWRKYGQKNVKANECIKSYYKCSNLNCPAKKQVERSQDGRITDVTYLGNHDHDEPHAEREVDVPSLLSAQVKIPACPAQEENSADIPAPAIDHVQSIDASETLAVKVVEGPGLASTTPPTQRIDDHHENLTPKKRKKVDSADITPEKPGHESRLVVQTVSEVDIVNDGYRWRKYGQKMVKGNSNPRSYYRCSTSGCPAKKHVERASYDPKVVITTYEHQHDHSIPLLRTIVPQSVAPSSGGLDSNGQEKSKSEENDGAQNAPTIETDKTDAVDPAAMEMNNMAVVDTHKEELSDDHKLLTKAEHDDHTDRMALQDIRAEVQAETKPDVTKSEEQVQDPPCTASVDAKPEVLSTEQKRTDPAVLGSSHTTTASSGQQRTNSEPLNKHH